MVFFENFPKNSKRLLNILTSPTSINFY